MPSKTIEDGLKRYAIARKLRNLRLRKSMGLVELGKHTGLSPAMLSKLERGVMCPTLPTLLRIAMVFSVGLEYFFSPEPKPTVAVVRRRDRLRFPDIGAGGPVSYHFESLDFPVSNPRLHAYYAEFVDVAVSSLRPHEHKGVEFLYLISGRLALDLNGEAHELAQGDAIYFDSAVPHSYRKLNSGAARALVVTTC